MEHNSAANATHTIKIAVDIEVNGKPALRASVQAESDAQAVQQAAAQLSAALASAVTQVIETQWAATPVPMQIATQPAVGLLQADEASGPAVPQLPAIITNSVAAEITAKAVPGKPALPQWLIRHRQRLAVGFGGLLVLGAMLVAVVFPPLVPRGQRIEVFMMSLAFGLIGAGALFAGALPARDDQPRLTELPTAPTERPFVPRYGSSKALLQKRKPLNAVWGLGFGVLFLLAGILAPFVLGQANADDRFLMMIGFAPVAVTGALMLAIFWRSFAGKVPASTPSPKPTHNSSARSTKPSVTRAPDQVAFRLGIPLLIGTSLVILIAVLALVIIATVLPILNR